MLLLCVFKRSPTQQIYAAASAWTPSLKVEGQGLREASNVGLAVNHLVPHCLFLCSALHV